jgi:hypothetical protein
VHHFSWTLTFPKNFHFLYEPRFEVFHPITQHRHEWLTEVLQPCFQYSDTTKTAFLAIRRPPVDYLYRITWRVPPRSVDASNVTPKQNLQRLDLREQLLNSKGVSPQQRALATRVSLLLLAFNTLLNQFLTRGVGAKVDVAFDISLMVLDDRDPAKPPFLQVVAGLPIFAQSPGYLDFSLEVGDGNAGRAFRKNLVRFYEKSKAKDNPKDNTYVEIPGQPGHPILFSIPLRHPGNGSLICCVLNIGATNETEASVLALLKKDFGNAWLIQAGHEFLLTKLSAECSVGLV